VQKSYYVDGHEREEQKQHRQKFCSEYLALEQRMHRWVQLTSAQLADMQSSLPDNNKITAKGSIHTNPETNEVLFKFHVDDHQCLQDYW
jgi:hypothetical protein